MFTIEMLNLMWTGLLETLYMTLISAALSYVLGLPLGLVLVVTDKDGVHPCPALNRALGTVVNALRSVPFLILLFTVLPVTRFLTGTTIGPTATIVPLTIAAAPFVARMVESSVREVDRGVIEASLSMGASTMQIVLRVLLPEALPSLINGARSQQQRFSAIPPWRASAAAADSVRSRSTMATTAVKWTSCSSWCSF